MSTTQNTYESDLQAATKLAATFVDFDAQDGNMRNAVQDALNNEWAEGLTIEQWVAQSLVRINHGQ